MAAEVTQLPQVKLAAGPAPFTVEQRYWKSFKSQLLIPSLTSAAITHISCPSTLLPSTTSSSFFSTSTTSSADSFAVTTGTRVQIYSIRTRKLVKTISRFGDNARSGEIRRDGRVLVAGEDSGRIQVFDVSSRSILRTWLDHKQPVWTTKFSPTELTTLLSASDDKTVRLWDLPSNDPVITFVGHRDYVRCASFMPGSVAKMVVSGSYDSTVKIWDPRAGGSVPVMTFKHAAPVEDVLPMPSGTTLLSAADSAITVLDLVAARPLHQITNHQKTVTSLCLASGARRLVSGGLDGHVKVFETTGWNVVSSTKYPSPILAVRVIAASEAHDAADRHLVVGMQSGLLSIRTRLSGAEAAKEKQREKEMSALLSGTIEKLDRKRARTKRRFDEDRRQDLVTDGVDVLIANQTKRSKREKPWHRAFRHAKYGEALDALLDKSNPDHSPLAVLTLLVGLRHRSALRTALEGRDERTVQPILRWVSVHVIDPRYVSVCVEAAVILLELYAEFADRDPELHLQFRMLRQKVEKEVERAQAACMINGMLESIMIGAV
jgi:U3 small nucleolar RNA-associated protein 15